MRNMKKLLTVRLIAGAAAIAFSSANAGWGNDGWGSGSPLYGGGPYGHRSPWGWGGYPSYGGWGGPYGWGGYPGGGWRGYPGDWGGFPGWGDDSTSNADPASSQPESK